MVELINDFLIKTFCGLTSEPLGSMQVKPSHWKYGRDCWFSYPHSQGISKLENKSNWSSTSLSANKAEFLLAFHEVHSMLLLSSTWKRNILELGNSTYPKQPSQKLLETQSRTRGTEVVFSALGLWTSLSNSPSPCSQHPSRRFCRGRPWNKNLSVGDLLWKSSRRNQ